MNRESFTVSIAPMMDVTDRHFRFFMRLISHRALLYTPMLTTKAILHGDRDRLLGFSPEELPLALQLGGDDPKELAVCARIGEEMEYTEINLNVGCPSSRVKKGHFGACLMATPERVAEGIAAMKQAVTIPVTVKHRIGIDDLDRYEDLVTFVKIVAEAGCDRFIVHARKAWLEGLSPKENRTVPPLRYDDVYRLKQEFPHLTIVINGGIRAVDHIREHLNYVDGVMVGRAASEDPFFLSAVDGMIFGNPSPCRSREEIIEAMTSYADVWIAEGTTPQKIMRHLLCLYKGVRGARAWRRSLGSNGTSFKSAK